MTTQISNLQATISATAAHVSHPAFGAEVVRPTIRTIVLADLVDALRKGAADFAAMPTHTMFLCIIYPIAGLLITRASMGGHLMPLAFPMAAGYALIGPLAALGLYEISRRREQGLETSWAEIGAITRSPSMPAIGGLGLVLLALFVAWIGTAHLIYSATLGPLAPTSVGQFVSDVFATSAGWALIVIGNLVGSLFAACALAVGIVSFPLLLDRNVGFTTAIVTSIDCVIANPGVLFVWGLIVAATLLVGTLPLFVGLAIVMPVLGHATWHLYRKLVEL
jgi:uncharacterized membrane protein